MVCAEVTDCLVWEDGFLCTDCYDKEVLNVNLTAPNEGWMAEAREVLEDEVEAMDDPYKAWDESIRKARDIIIKRNEKLDKKGTCYED